MSVTFLQELPKSALDPKETIHPSDEMLMARHHVFSTYDKNGLEAADSVVLSRHNNGKITDEQCIGLDAELRFFSAFKEELCLVPALDCGDNTDFVGFFKGHFVRFDVTTNLSEKQDDWSRYLRYENHVIALCEQDRTTWSYFIADKNHEGKFLRCDKEILESATATHCSVG